LKPEPVRKPINQFEEKEVDFKIKKAIMDEMISVAGPDTDYTDFVRKNYKQGSAHCLNAWFESQN